jgi:hypothetical protein
VQEKEGRRRPRKAEGRPKEGQRKAEGRRQHTSSEATNFAFQSTDPIVLNFALVTTVVAKQVAIVASLSRSNNIITADG